MLRTAYYALGMTLGMALLPRLVAQRTSLPAAPAEVDPQIAAALQQISVSHIEADIKKLVSFSTRHTLSSQDPASVASGRGIGAARDWISAEFQRYAQACGGCLLVQADRYQQAPVEGVPKTTLITNVYATLRGADPNNDRRIYLVTGHYDSRNGDPYDASGPAPGANDDASGTAVSLECARVLSRYKFPATLVFLAVAGEEQGLYGSQHFAQAAKTQNWNLEAVLNNDIVGGDRSPGQDPGKVRVFSEGIPLTATEAETRRIRALGGENDSPSRQLARYMAEVARTYLPPSFAPVMIYRLDRYLRGGDHLSFNQQGFAAVRITEYRENYHHQHQNVRPQNGIAYGDLPSFVDYAYVANVARLNAATLAALASAPAPPANVRLLTRELENTSTLTWEPSPGGLATGYEVLWRPTTAADWQNVQAVGNVTRATLDLSKDNVIFAVRALDGKGRRSLEVVPQPER